MEIRKAKIFLLFGIFFRISLLTVGGGIAMLPLVEKALVTDRKFISEDDMADIVAAVQSMPGIIAVNMAVMSGYRVAGVLGAVVASFGAALPPFIAIIAVASFFLSWKDVPVVQGMFSGVRACVCGLILASAVRMGMNLLRDAFAWCVCVVAFLVIVFLPQIDVIFVLLISGMAGMIRSFFLCRTFDGTEKKGEKN